MVIGIDLGSTFSVGAYVDSKGKPHVVHNCDGSNTTPSVVMFDDNEILVGVQAMNNAALDPVNVVHFVKRNMGDHEWSFDSDSGDRFSAEEISAMILKRIKEDCEAELGEPISRAVITVPAYFSAPQRQATKDAGKLAGLDVMEIINEPVAAVLAYGITKLGIQQRVMVYDLGGGTCDVTIIEISPEGSVKVLATHGNRNLGGCDFDNRLVAHIAEQIREKTGADIEDDVVMMQMLCSKCEEAKIGLSASEKFRISLSAMGMKYRKEITREEFEELIKDLVEMTDIDIETALDDAGLQPSDIDKVILVGGSTKVPAVRKFVETRMNMKPSAELDADEVVAIGAAIYADEIKERATESGAHGVSAASGGASENLSAPVIQTVSKRKVIRLDSLASVSPLNVFDFFINHKHCQIRIFAEDLTTSVDTCDVVVCSAFKNDYTPVPGTLIGSLWSNLGISVQGLSRQREIDMLSQSCWLSEEIPGKIRRIACLELLDWNILVKMIRHGIEDSGAITLLKSSFLTLRHLLETADERCIPIRSVALPVLGSGNQGIEIEYIAVPLFHQCKKMFQTIDSLTNIDFYERNRSRAQKLNEILFSLIDRKDQDVFISYSSKQTDRAHVLGNFLTAEGLSIWIAPEGIPPGSDYTAEIPAAISNAKAVVLVFTPEAMRSPWVRREVSTAIGAGKAIIPAQYKPFDLSREFAFLLDGVQILPVWPYAEDQQEHLIFSQLQEKVRF